MKRCVLWLLVNVCCAFLVGACGGGSNRGPAATVTADAPPPSTAGSDDPSTASSESTAVAELKVRCNAPMHAIEGSGRQATGGVTIVNGDCAKVGGDFTATGSMLVARTGHSAVLLNDGKVLIIGGDRRAEIFDPGDAAFVPTGEMLSEYPGSKATLLGDGRVLVTGGRDHSNLTAEIFDPTTGSFRLTGNPLPGQGIATATLLADGRVLFAGGVSPGAGGGLASSSSQIYDPATRLFTATSSMVSPRANPTATRLNDGTVLIVGGWNGHRADAADDPPWDPMFAESFDPATGEFSRSASMSTTRAGDAIATRLANGDVLVMGGIWPLQNVHEQPPFPRYAEVFDAAHKEFHPLSFSLASRHGDTATLLDDGRVLLCGGQVASGDLSAAGVLDPQAGTLALTNEPLSRRFGHTATRLLDGRVLITGGTDVAGNVLATAEIWTPKPTTGP